MKAISADSVGIKHRILAVLIGLQPACVLAVSIGFFSLFATASALARSYAQQFLARLGVAEVTATPAGMSMMSDHFPPERLGRAGGAFFVSAPIGPGLGLIGGGLLLQRFATSAFLSCGPMAGCEPPQAALIMIGAPRLLSDRSHRQNPEGFGDGAASSVRQAHPNSRDLADHQSASDARRGRKLRIRAAVLSRRRFIRVSARGFEQFGARQLAS